MVHGESGSHNFGGRKKLLNKKYHLMNKKNYTKKYWKFRMGDW